LVQGAINKLAKDSEKYPFPHGHFPSAKFISGENIEDKEERGKTTMTRNYKGKICVTKRKEKGKIKKEKLKGWRKSSKPYRRCCQRGK
jgi:hypothetical protein